MAQSAQKITATSANDSTGYLLIKTEVDSFYVVVNDDFKNVAKIANNDILQVKSGRQKIRIIKKYYRDMVATARIKPDTLNSISTNMLPFRKFEHMKRFSSYPRVFWKVPFVVKTDPDASIYIDDEYIGTGLARVDSTGYIKIRSELPEGKTKTEAFYIRESTRQTFFVEEIYHRPEKKKSRYLSLLPGASQLYQDQKLKGYALLGATLIGGGLAVKFHLDFTNTYQDFRHNRRGYMSATDPDKAFVLGNRADQQLDKANRKATLRDVMIYGAVGSYIYSLIDGLIKPETGYREEINIDPYIDFEDGYINNMGVSAQFNF